MVQTSAELHNSSTTCTFSPENIWQFQVTLLTTDWNKPTFYIPKFCVYCNFTHIL